MATKTLWRLVTENQRGKQVNSIIRNIARPDGSFTKERYLVSKYKDIRNSPELLQALVQRLNFEIEKVRKAQQTVAYKHAFIDDELKQEFLSLMLAQIPSKDRALTNFHYLEKHFLTFFIQALNLADPKDWYAVHQTKWADYLIKNKIVVAPATKREVIQVANRFMRFLHSKRPSEIPLYKFAPISSAVFKQIEAQRKITNKGDERMAIEDKDWAVIKTKLPEAIKGFANLAYCYGLRRSEALGLSTGDVKKGYLSIERQLVSLDPKPVYGPLKGREDRKINYWYSTPKETHDWIKNGSNQLIHPDTLSDRWRELMDELDFNYDFHDLRHTFITKAISAYPPRDVQLAAGHKSIETTMRYAHDNRNLDDEVFNPEEIAS